MYWLIQVVLEKKPLNGCSSSKSSSIRAYHRLQCHHRAQLARRVQQLQPCRGWVLGTACMETVPWAAAAAASECGNTVKRNQLSTAVRSNYLTFHHTVTVCKCNVSKQSLPSFIIQNFRLIHNTALLWCLMRYNCYWHSKNVISKWTSYIIIHREKVTQFRSISMPAGLCRHLVGKTLRNICYSDVT